MVGRAKRTPTWLDVAVHNVGIRLAVRALNWAYMWAVVRESQHGREPTAEEVAKWWNMPVRTAYRDQADFRRAFPTLDSPAPIYATPESREAVAKHARIGDKIEQWGEDGKKAREESAFRAAQFPATGLPT